jgi:low affinity Fe/Cu permease
MNRSGVKSSLSPNNRRERRIYQMEHFLSIEGWFTIFCGIFIETLILGTFIQYMLTRNTEKKQKHLEKTILKLEDKIQRISNMEQQQLKSLETFLFSIKEELKDEMRGIAASKGGGDG